MAPRKKPKIVTTRIRITKAEAAANQRERDLQNEVVERTKDLQHRLDKAEKKQAEYFTALDQAGADLEDAKDKIGRLEMPIPIILTCPQCGARHIDEGEWATRVHHTHSCQTCGMTWRPAVVATVGVQFLPGFRNAPPSDKPSKVAGYVKDVAMATMGMYAMGMLKKFKPKAEE